MARLRSFATPHKGLRNIISRFSYYLGNTDLADTGQRTYLKQLGHEMFTLLNDHVHTENEHTLKNLEQRAPGTSTHDIEDHERLEAIQHNLEQQLTNLTGDESAEDLHLFYLSFSRFHSQYLEHIYEEETVTEMLLQKHFTDEELIDHRKAIMQKVHFPTMLLWLKYTIPAQREDENLGMLRGFKANAPQEAYDQVLAIIRGEMDADRYEQLISKI